MRLYIVRRLLLALVVVLLVTAITFIIMRLLPGDPALAALGGQVASAEVLEQLREEMGLNQSLPEQYVDFLLGAVRGDLGRSLRTRALVTDEIALALPATAELTAGSLLIAMLLGVPLGAAAAVWQNTWIDWTGISLSVLGVSVPVFWMGLLLISVFSFGLGWLPAGGLGGVRALLLPALTLGLGGAAIIARMTRSSLLEVLGHDYIRTARAKGVRETLVISKHALRNALIPVITTVGLQVGGMLSGAVLVETVFARPGVGRLLLQAVQSRDFPVAQAVILMVASFYVLVNLAVDLLYAVLDPRIRYS